MYTLKRIFKYCSLNKTMFWSNLKSSIVKVMGFLLFLIYWYFPCIVLLMYLNCYSFICIVCHFYGKYFSYSVETKHTQTIYVSIFIGYLILCIQWNISIVFYTGYTYQGTNRQVNPLNTNINPLMAHAYRRMASAIFYLVCVCACVWVCVYMCVGSDVRISWLLLKLTPTMLPCFIAPVNGYWISHSLPSP